MLLSRALPIAIVAILLAAAAPLPGTEPAPVEGITFDEWASASARLAAGRPREEIEHTLGVTAPQYEAANTAFGEALKSGPPGGPLIDRFGVVFNNPNAGRFAAAGNAPKPKEIDSYEQYVDIQVEMTAAQEAGKDPVAVLKEKFGMTPFDYAQQGGRWVQAMADAASNDPAQLRAWNAYRDRALAEARKRYGASGRKLPQD